jgi:hypothetical protein
MVDGELEAHDSVVTVYGVAVVVLVQLEQLQRAMTQLLNLLVAVVDTSQVVVVNGVKFVFRAEQHFANDHINNLGRHDQVDLIALHVNVTIHGVGTGLHRIKERILLVGQQRGVLGPLDGVLPLDMLEHEVSAERDHIELVGLARAMLAIVQEYLLAEVFAEFAAGFLDARTFLSSHFQGVLAPVRELPAAARLCHSRQWNQ